MAGLGVLYMFGDSISAIVLGCGSILIGITDDYGNHMLYHTEESPSGGPEEQARKAVDLVLPLICSALVTMGTFLVLTLSPVTGHRQVGVFAASGVMFAALFAIVLLPGLIAGRVKEAATPLPLTALVRRVFAWRDRYSRPILGLLLLWSAIDGLYSLSNTRRPEVAQPETVTRTATRRTQRIPCFGGSFVCFT